MDTTSEVKMHVCSIVTPNSAIFGIRICDLYVVQKKCILFEWLLFCKENEGDLAALPTVSNTILVAMAPWNVDCLPIIIIIISAQRLSTIQRWAPRGNSDRLNYFELQDLLWRGTTWLLRFVLTPDKNWLWKSSWLEEILNSAETFFKNARHFGCWPGLVSFTTT